MSDRRGRPPRRFLDDPDRYLMALALAYWALGASQRGACEIAVATVEGKPVVRNRKRGKGGHGLNLLEWEFSLRPGAARTIEGRARGLRRKIKQACEDDAAADWLQRMGEMHLLALRWRERRLAADQAAAEIMRQAEALGEASHARRLLLATMNF
jgi:hypothetical protein